MTGLHLVITVVDEDGNEYNPDNDLSLLSYSPLCYKRHYMLNKNWYPFLHRTNPKVTDRGFEKALHKIICFFINKEIGKVVVKLDEMEEGLKNEHNNNR